MRGVVRTADERARLIDSYRASGLSAKTFAERERIPLSSFYQWLAKPKPPAQSVRIARVVRRAVPPAHEAAIVIDVGPARVHVQRGFDRAILADVLDVLAARNRENAT